MEKKGRSTRARSGGEVAAESTMGQPLLRAVLGRAQSDVGMVTDLLESTGVLPPLAERLKNPVPLPLDLMLRLAVRRRLQYWESSGVHSRLGNRVPSSAAVWADLRKAPADASYPTRKLVQRNLSAFLQELAWDQANSTSDVAFGSAERRELLDRLIAFLWQHRHSGKSCSGASGQ